MKKLFTVISTMLLIISCNKKGEVDSQVVYWAAFLDTSVPIHKELREGYSNYLKENPDVPLASEDNGPTLYRERAQRYLLQGKTGIPNALEGTLEQVYSYVAAGMAEPIQDLVNNDPDSKNLYPNLLEALTINGNLYAIPNAVNVRLLVYRKDLLEKYNLAVPKTWDDLIKVAKTIKEKEGINGFMFTTQTKEVRAFQEFMSFYFTLADSMYKIENNKAEYIADKKHFEQVFTLYKDLFDVAIDQNAKSQDWKAVDYGVTGGQTAMVTVGPWIWEHLKEDSSRDKIMTNLHVAAIPIPPNGSEGTYMEVKGIVFNPHAKKEMREDTYKVMKGFISKPYSEASMEAAGGTSVRKDVVGDNYFSQGFAKYLDSGKVLEFINWEIPQNYIIEGIQAVIYGQATPEQAADKLDKQLKDYASTAIPKE